MPKIKSRSAVCKASTLCVVLSLWPMPCFPKFTVTAGVLRCLVRKAAIAYTDTSDSPSPPLPADDSSNDCQGKAKASGAVTCNGQHWVGSTQDTKSHLLPQV